MTKFDKITSKTCHKTYICEEDQYARIFQNNLTHFWLIFLLYIPWKRKQSNVFFRIFKVVNNFHEKDLS